MMAILASNTQQEMATSVAKGLMCVLGFAVVISTMISVSQNKLAFLRKQLENQDGYVSTVMDKTKQLDCLTRNIYWEAATEPFEGKAAVAQVTMNRLASGNFGKDLCGVIYQKNVIYEKAICQFSWVCEGNWKIKPIMPKHYAESEEVAKKVLFENFRLPSLTEALFYHADYVRPNWNKVKIAKIGQHIFYK